MDSIVITRILIDGALLTAGLTIVILASLNYNPRLWLQDFPAEMKAVVPPLSPKERRDRWVVGIFFFAIAIGVIIYSVAQLRAHFGGPVPFLTTYVTIFGVYSVFNLFDAVVLDLGLMTFMKPKFAVLPGAEGMEYLYQNWGMHFTNFLKGVVFSALLALPVALIAAL